MYVLYNGKNDMYMADQLGDSTSKDLATYSLCYQKQADTRAGRSFRQVDDSIDIVFQGSNYQLDTTADKTQASTPEERQALFACQQNQNETCRAGPRTYTRVDTNVPDYCEAKCFLNQRCVAWTWNENECRLTVQLREVTPIPANTALMMATGISTTQYCEDNHVFDPCVQKCVHIENHIAMGWCNHHWVLCQQGKYSSDQSPDSDDSSDDTSDRLCVGGGMPNDHRPESVMHVPDKSTMSSSYSKELNASAAARTRMSLIGQHGGVYKAKSCGDLGASLSPADLSSWKKWHVDISPTKGRPSAASFTDPLSYFNRFMNELHWRPKEHGNKRVYVTASLGSRTVGTGAQIDGLLPCAKPDIGVYSSQTSGIDRLDGPLDPPYLCSTWERVCQPSNGNDDGSEGTCTTDTYKQYVSGDCDGRICVHPTCMIPSLALYSNLVTLTDNQPEPGDVLQGFNEQCGYNSNTQARFIHHAEGNVHPPTLERTKAEQVAILLGAKLPEDIQDNNLMVCQDRQGNVLRVAKTRNKCYAATSSVNVSNTKSLLTGICTNNNFVY